MKTPVADPAVRRADPRTLRRSRHRLFHVYV